MRKGEIGNQKWLAGSNQRRIGGYRDQGTYADGKFYGVEFDAIGSHLRSWGSVFAVALRIRILVGGYPAVSSTFFESVLGRVFVEC